MGRSERKTPPSVQTHTQVYQTWQNNSTKHTPAALLRSTNHRSVLGVPVSSSANGKSAAQTAPRALFSLDCLLELELVLE